MVLQDTTVSEILFCSKIYPKPAAALPAAARHAHALIYFVEGEGEYVYEDKAYRFAPGSVVFLPKGRPYLIRRFSASQLIYVDFLTADDALLSPFSKAYPNAAQFRDVFTALASQYKQKRVGYQAEMMSALYKLIAMLQAAERVSYFPSVKYQKIAAAVDCINRNYTNGTLRVSALAEMSGMSTRYFGELFSAFFGVPPKTYILRMQLETAKNLLLSSDEPVGDIAVVCGFVDVYSFSKIFKRETGKTPSAFRKAGTAL